MFVSRSIDWADDDCGQKEVVAVRASRSFRLENVESYQWQEQVLELYERFHLSLFRYLRTLGVSLDEGHDLIQEIFLRLATHLRAGGSHKNLRSWLFQVAHNLSMDIHRGRRKVQLMSELDGENVTDIADPKSDPELKYMKKEQLKRLDTAMAELTPQQRSSIILRAEGLRYWEIANVLGVSEQRAIVLVKRGLLCLTKGL